jgi:hypothetical protein
MKTIIDAILAINPNAEVSMGDYRDINSITWLSGNEIPHTDIEAKLVELQAQEEIEKIEIANAKAQKEADALAGNNKLLELGLTQAQVTAMTGYKPPVSE